MRLTNLTLKEKGQGIVEYALVLAFVVVIAVVIGGDELNEKILNAFTSMSGRFDEIESM